jgi:hypothetical protein
MPLEINRRRQKKVVDRETKAIQKQLAEDLELANKPAKKALKKQLVSITSKAKKATLVVLTKRKAPIKARCPAKVVV